jgi:formate/nitrite transporter FocA (FNT family)
MWMPILVFFYMGFEHSVVNMFLFPSGLMLGGDFSIVDYLVWNELPTVIGNLVGGLTFVGLTLYATHARPGAGRRPSVREDVGIPAELGAPR